MRRVSEDKNEVEIFGYLPPPSRGRQTKWYLTVFEDGKGVPERHPKFRPEQEVMVRLCVVCSKLILFSCVSRYAWFQAKKILYISYIIDHLYSNWFST